MIDALVGGLEWFHRFSDPLAWAVIATFLGGVLLERRAPTAARYVTVAAWVLFAAFWLSLVHYYGIAEKSIVEGVGSAVAVPASLYVAYLLHQGRGSLFVLSRAVAVMGLVFMPFEAIPMFHQWIVEVVTRQTELLMGLVGHHPEVILGSQVPGGDYPPYRSTFFFTAADGHQITYTIRIACTGIGSMAIFAGLIGAVRAPLDRKVRALAVSLPVIYALNLVRNVFIGLSFGQQRMHIAPDLIMGLFGATDPYMVSYYWADRILAQSLSVVALVGITYLVVRELPEVLTVVEDVLFVFTGTEYDLMDALDVERPVRADGDGR